MEKYSDFIIFIFKSKHNLSSDLLKSKLLVMCCETQSAIIYIYIDIYI